MKTNEKNMPDKKTWPQKKPWHDTDPPQQLHWVRIILGKLDTIQNHHTNQDTTLFHMSYVPWFLRDPQRWLVDHGTVKC